MRGGSRDGMDSADPPASSIVAIEAMVDDVSMTKITFRPDQAAVAAEMLDLDQSGAAHLQTVAPFDDHRALLGELLEAEVRQQGAVVIEWRSEEHTSELQSHLNLVCRLLLEKKKQQKPSTLTHTPMPP